MNVEVLPTAADAARRAADLVEACLDERPDACIALPAGRTPVALYAELLARGAAERLERARLFQLDEVVGAAPGDPRSFQAFLRRHLVHALGPNACVHLLDGSAPDPAAEIARHAAALAGAGGLDLALLGLGTNGHVAFNEPGSERDAPARVVELAADTRAATGAELGITLGLRELLAARRTRVLVTGAAKRAALERFASGPIGASCPATYLREHPDCTVLADASAAP